jgi:benzodiazapine receptor
MKEIPVLSDAPAAARAREDHHDDVESPRKFGQAPGLEVARGPPRRLRAAAIATICVLTTSVSSFIFTNPRMPRLDPVIEFPWFVRIGPSFVAIWAVLTGTLIASFYLVLRTAPDTKQRRQAIAAYVAQLALNTVWAWLLFAERSVAVSLCAAGLFVMSVLASVWVSAQINKRASALLSPNLAWAIFTLISTAKIFRE